MSPNLLLTEACEPDPCFIVSAIVLGDSIMHNMGVERVRGWLKWSGNECRPASIALHTSSMSTVMEEGDDSSRLRSDKWSEMMASNSTSFQVDLPINVFPCVFTTDSSLDFISLTSMVSSPVIRFRDIGFYRANLREHSKYLAAHMEAIDAYMEKFLGPRKVKPTPPADLGHHEWNRYSWLPFNRLEKSSSVLKCKAAIRWIPGAANAAEIAGIAPLPIERGDRLGIRIDGDNSPIDTVGEVL